MKRLSLIVLTVAMLASCQEKKDSGAVTYTAEFLNSFLQDKKAMLAQQHLLNEETDRLDIMVLDMLQSGPKFMPFTPELINMKRNKQAVKEGVYRNIEKMHALNDEILLRKKDQATIEKEWLALKKDIREATTALQNMNSENERRFREFNGQVNNLPEQPAGPRLAPQNPPPVR